MNRSAGFGGRRRARECALRAYYDDEVVARANRDVDPERVARRESFIERLVREGRRSVLELGCGPGRDGVSFVEAGFDYTGVDLAPRAVAHCRRLGLRAEVASVLDLPFADASFDAAWTMSTLLHVADEELQTALNEIARVLMPGAALVVGLWGGVAQQGLYRDGKGLPARFFAIRPDSCVRSALEAIGSVQAFDTWAHPDRGSGLHYQLVEVPIGRFTAANSVRRSA